MLLSLPPETIEKVVTFLTAQVSIGGPPPNLYALMRTCRYMYYLLSPEHNPGMFYRLFRDYFDLAARGDGFLVYPARQPSSLKRPASASLL